MHLHNVDDVLVFQPLHSETRNHSDCAPEFWTCSGWRQPPWRITDLRRLRADCVHAKIAELHAGGQLQIWAKKHQDAVATKFLLQWPSGLAIFRSIVVRLTLAWSAKPAVARPLVKLLSSRQLLYCLFIKRLSFRHLDHLVFHLERHRDGKNSWAAVVSSYFHHFPSKLRFCSFTWTNTDCIHQHSKTIHNMRWLVIFIIKSRSCDATDAKFIAGRHRTILVEEILWWLFVILEETLIKGTCYTKNIKTNPVCKFVTCRLSGVSSRFVPLEVNGVHVLS